MTSTSISCRGDRRYVMRLKALAAQHGVTLADLTRNALDSQYGDQLSRLSDFFDADTVASKQQICPERIEEVTE